MLGNMDFTEILEVLVVVLVAIEIVELYFNIRATRTHEKELDAHLRKLERAAEELEKYTSCVNQLDEHVRTLDRLLQKTNSSKS
jgi:biopolymer transport protein ExbB/TolQ